MILKVTRVSFYNMLHNTKYSYLKENNMENDFINVEIYTEKLNDMYARISEFMSGHPNSTMINQLSNQQHLLALARHKSRFHDDEKHFMEWDNLLKESEKMMGEAIVEDVLG